MNTKLLRKVQKHILAEPRRLNMDCILIRDLDTEDTDNPLCGTVGCIAGWAWVISGKKGDDFNLADAGKELALRPIEQDRLFTEPKYAWEGCHSTWPIDFAKAYRAASDAETRAEVTSKRIDHFIKTKGRE